MKRVFAFIGFSFAITLFLLNIISFTAVKYVLLTSVILAVMSFAIKKIRQARVIPVILCSCAFACLLFSFVYTQFTAPQLALDKKEAQAEITITSYCRMNSAEKYKYRYSATINKLDDESCDIKIILNTKTDLDTQPYEKISTKLKLYKIGSEAYSSYGYYSDGIYLSAIMKGSYSHLPSDDYQPVMYYVLELSKTIKTVIKSNIEGDAGDLAVAVLTGDTDYLSEDIINDFRICGISHIVAVSGLHTTLICFGFYFILKLLRTPKPLCAFLTALFIIGYISLTGFSMSAVRAGIMIIVMLASKLVNSHSDALNSLGLATFLICLNPYAVFDASAALSITAVLGILIVYPSLRKKCRKESKPCKFILDSVYATVSVTFTMMPVMCFYFRYISLVGIILNIVFILLLEISLSCVCFVVLLSKAYVLLFLPKIIAKALLSLMILLADAFADGFYWMSISTENNYLLISFALFLLFLGASLIINKRISVRVSVIVFSLLLVTAMSFTAYEENATITVECMDSGGVIIKSRDELIAVDINEKSELYELKKESRYKRCICVACDSCEEEISCAFTDTVFINNDMPENDFLNGISFARSGNNTSLIIFDNDFKLQGNNVIINKKVLDRRSLTSMYDSITFYFKTDSEVRYSYGKNK